MPKGAENILVELIERIYSYTTTALSESNGNIFEILVVRQGGPESPTLYNLFMDYVMRTFINICERKNIKFMKTKYTVPRTETTSSSSISGTYGSKQ